MSLDQVARPDSFQAPRLKQVALVMPLALLLLWTAAVRLPFYAATNGDEYFFSVIADQWLHGGLPYVATFDIKPPGLFLIFAVVQEFFGASYATFKGMEIVAVALGAGALYAPLKTLATRRLAIWVAILYPVYTLAFEGAAAVNMLLQLPLIILSFGAVMSAVRDVATASDRLRYAFLAGLAIGAAGMIKQTAVFEAAAVFLAICLFGERGMRIRMLALFVAGAAVPAAVFSTYFLAVGHFGEMFQAVVVLALQRIDDSVASAYGPDMARYLTFPGAMENALLRSATVIFLWGGALFAVLRLARIRRAVPARMLAISGLWLGAGFLSAAAGRLLCDYYLLTIVPPLLIVAGAFYCYGLDVRPQRAGRAFLASVFAGIAMLGYAEHRTLFDFAKYQAEHDLVSRTADAIRDLGLAPADKLLVLNRGLALHVETGARPPSKYFHGTHLLSPFRTPSADPLAEALATNPRFIVLADPSLRLLAETPARYRQALDYLAQHYRAATVVKGTLDTYVVYEFRG
ncbi:MAG: hypothetical protein WDM94_06425 [Bauldia sp.]